MNQLITNLGKESKLKLRNYYNQVSGTNAKTITQIKKLLLSPTANDAWEYITREYNNQVVRNLEAENAKYFAKKTTKRLIRDTSASTIARYSRKYRQPITPIDKVTLKGSNNTWFKDFVSQYQVNLPELLDLTDILNNPDPKQNVFKNKLLPILGNLWALYRGGFVQIDMYGYWGNLEKNIDYFKTNPTNEQKVYVEGIILKPSNYKDLIANLIKSLKPPESDSYFLVQSFIVKFVKPATGGGSNNQKGSIMTIGKLKLFNHHSTNNNCFFKCIADKVDFLITTKKCNEIRKEFSIPDNTAITVEEAIKIAAKYLNQPLLIVTNNMDVLAGDPEAELKLFYLNNHYMSFNCDIKRCKNCGVVYKYDGHKCNLKASEFRNMKIKRLINVNNEIDDCEDGCEEDNQDEYEEHDLSKENNKDKFVLHYDIESQYTNGNHQHMPYIVGFCHYKLLEKKISGYTERSNGAKIPIYEFIVSDEIIYNVFTGDKCMEEFYNYLGTKDVDHITHLNAFYGSGFDHYYLFRIKLEEAKKVGKFILANGNLISGTIQKKKLFDIARHLTGTLKENLEAAGCSIAKGSLDHNLSKRWEDTDEARRKECLDYLKCDVLGLRELYEKTNKPFNVKYGTNLTDTITTSQNAYKMWVRRFLRDEHKIYLLKPNTDKLVRTAIYGARCYKNKNRFESSQYDDIISGKITCFEIIKDYIFDADVVSLYPAAMKLNPYPIGEEITTPFYKDGKLGIYKIKYKAPKNLLTPILPRKKDKSLIWDLEDGEGWYSSVDIEEAKKKGYKIEIIIGFYWEESGYIFKDYMDEFFKMKAEAKKGTPAYSLAKLYLNGLYGKMLQKPHHSKTEIAKTETEFWCIVNKGIIEKMDSIGNGWIITYLPKQEAIEPSGGEKPTHLGVFILAYSRKIMNQYYDKCGNTVDALPYYYDTDSINIHASHLDNIPINKALGGIDDDIGGKIIKAFYIAPKMYAFQYIVNKEKIDILLKGNPNLKYEKCSEDTYLLHHFRGKGVLNSRMGWNNFIEMDKGLSQEFDRDFQIKKNNTKAVLGYDYFSHKHLFKEDTVKLVNQKPWNGRHFYDSNNSVPWGFVF